MGVPVLPPVLQVDCPPQLPRVDLGPASSYAQACRRSATFIIQWAPAGAPTRGDGFTGVVGGGDRDGARPRFEQGLAIAERLAPADPEDPSLQRDLSFSYE